MDKKLKITNVEDSKKPEIFKTMEPFD